MTSEREKILADIEDISKRAKSAALIQQAVKHYHQGDLADALAACEEATRLYPHSADAHNKRATILMAMKRFDEAGKAFETALSINPQLKDASYLLATLGKEEAPSKAPKTYVAALFDHYADRFDEELVGRLGYQTPLHLLNAVSQSLDNTSKKIDILDLGCGTGLSGAAFSELANQMVGVDLSPRMIEKAKELGIYSDFIQADICQALAQCEQKFDLILSSDVFVYIGKLEEVFTLAEKCLNTGGIIAFSIEVNDSGEDYLLRPTGRYAQSPDYIRRLAKDGGFEVFSYTPVTLRYEAGEPIAGCVFVLCRLS